MANENTREQKLKYAFGAHPSLKELHVASDDSMFLNASDAANHAKTLENAEVKIEKRSDYIESKVAPAAPNQLDLELEALRARYLELFKQKAAHNAGIDKLKQRIADEEARLAEVATKDAEALASGAGEEPGAEGGSEGAE
ncbi:hypothetical protein [Sphingobacterium luzhongxinii]|uniref:hypothetical protein n=1 Tax=Sphingobacterium luzhongxinii TaxID=2654181 RepID=UPI0013DBBEED|nr:hypothetical protein [Sphingobacterium sp. xlx-73]